MASPSELVASSSHLRRASEKSSAIPVGEEKLVGNVDENESRAGGSSRREAHQSAISSPWGENAHRVYVISRTSGRGCAALFLLYVWSAFKIRASSDIAPRARGSRERVILIADDSIVSGDKSASPDGLLRFTRQTDNATRNTAYRRTRTDNTPRSVASCELGDESPAHA